MKNLSIYCILCMVTVVAGSCKKVFFEPEPENNNIAVFEVLCESFREFYGPFGDRGVNWDSLVAAYRPMVTNESSESDFYTVVTSMLDVLNDGHVQITSPGREVYYSNSYYRHNTEYDLFDKEVVKQKYLTSIVEEKEEGYVYGILSGKILYIHFDYVSQNMLKLQEAIDRYPQSSGIIIDLRHNSGGDFTWAFESFGKLTDQPRKVFSSTTKNGPGENDFDPWHDWVLDPNDNYYGKKIVMLTDRFTMSAAERAAMALKVLPDVTHIGDYTNGSMATMIGRELQNGWYYTLPVQRTKFVDGKSYEGIGLPPDVLIKNSVDRLEQGIDDVLERAVSEF